KRVIYRVVGEVRITVSAIKTQYHQIPASSYYSFRFNMLYTMSPDSMIPGVYVAGEMTSQSAENPRCLTMAIPLQELEDSDQSLFVSFANTALAQEMYGGFMEKSNHQPSMEIKNNWH